MLPRFLPRGDRAQGEAPDPEDQSAAPRLAAEPMFRVLVHEKHVAFFEERYRENCFVKKEKPIASSEKHASKQNIAALSANISSSYPMNTRG